jgi:hypothetical protein
MPDLQGQIQEILADTAARIAALLQKAAMDSISSTLGVLEGAGTAPRRASSRRRAPDARTAGSRRMRGKGAKRPAEEIETAMKTVAAFIAKNPGLRIEQINKELGTTTAQLALPLRKLIADKTIKTKGQKRATTYFRAKA